MGARFIVRFDDFCPTMNWTVWEAIETILDRYGIRPIIAVIPENKDPQLMVAEVNPDFGIEFDCGNLRDGPSDYMVGGTATQL